MQTVMNFLRRFFFDLFHAILFWAEGFDIELRATKTPMQRVLTWCGVIILALLGCGGFDYFFWKFLDSFEVPTI